MASFLSDNNEFNLKIFNRWGELIWESSDPDIHWDGTYQNKTVKDGTYTYKLNYSIEFVLDKVLVGHVVVMQ
jgi:gliding motility-associated-like protein